jgi:hypothetical protein
MTTLSTKIYNGILAVSSGGTGAATLDKSLNALGGQSLLVSGANIGTVNGNSLLGSTNIAITEDTSTTVQTSAYTASANQLVKCNTTSSAFTVTLPLSPVDGDIIKIVDVVGKFGTNALTVSPNGKTIENDTSLILDVNNANISIMYINNNWKLLDIAPTTWTQLLFSTDLYIGNGATQTITNGINLAGKGGMVWLKTRTNNPTGTTYGLDSNANALVYFPNGIQGSACFSPIDTYGLETNYNLFTASTGWSTQGNVHVNCLGVQYASWTFRKAPKFFDIVTYTGDGNASRAIPHSLGIGYGLVLIKCTNSASNWGVYARDSTGGFWRLVFNTTAAQSGMYSEFQSSTVFYPSDLGSAVYNVNGGTYVAYLFGHNTTSTGMIQCGSYTGNGSATGPIVSLGWEPKWLMIKNASGTGSWQIIDNMRGMVVGAADATLQANAATAETSVDYVSPTATGFQVTSTSAEVNTSSSSYIYMAIRK